MQTPTDRRAAIESLLPLLEAHLDLHNQRTTQRYGAAEGEPPGPPHAEPNEELWALEWLRLRKAYPVLWHLERLMPDLAYEHADWACALYYVHVQPWPEYEHERRLQRAAWAVEWLAERCPFDVPAADIPVVTLTDRKSASIVRLRTERGLSVRQIAQRVGCSKSLVHEILCARGVRLVR